jgi:hypothetical protein
VTDATSPEPTVPDTAGVPEPPTWTASASASAPAPAPAPAPQADPTGAPAAGPTGPTGHPGVDAALARLDEVADGTPAEQVPAFDAAHRALTTTLSSIDQS